jgi:predicted amidohydrolase YtcJ
MSLQQQQAGQDLIVLADRIHTCSPDRTVEAVLLRNGRVAATGAAADLRRRFTGARIAEFVGCSITPGLTDAHVHLTEWAFARRQVDLSGAGSAAEAAAMLSHAEPGAGWLHGRGWNPHGWSGPPPHRSLLDARVADRPVALQSHDMHTLWVNTAALRAAGITAATPDPDGGTIERDHGGEATGLLREWAGQLITQCIPRPRLEDALSAVDDAQRELHSLGITAVHSFPGVHLVEPHASAVVQRLRDTGRLAVRVLQHVSLEQLDVAIEHGFRSGAGDAWLRCGGVKMFLDGALGSRTAWLREPYEGDTSCGMQVMAAADFAAHARRAAAHGIACTVHAIGDAAVDLALDVLSDENIRVVAMPHRIEHLQCCPTERFADAARAGIVCSMQPSHLMTDWRIADAHWGAARSRGAYAFGSLLHCGTILAFGSDVPVEPVDPRRGLFAAVTRQDERGLPACGWHAAERISAHDALTGYTVGPARAAGLPAPAGSLAPGAFADLAVWDHDPCGAPDRLLHMRCIATFIGGAQVHSS